MTIQTIGNYGGPPQPAAGAASEPRVAAPPPVAHSEVVAQAAPVEQPSREQVQKAVEEIKKSLSSSASSLQFSIDGDTGKTLVRVVDQQTGQTIRQIPSEEVLAMAKAVDRMKGILLKQQA